MHPSGDEHWTRRMPERITRGPAAQGAKLTAEQIEELRQLAKGGASAAWIGRKLGVSRFTVWRHITGKKRS